MTDTHRVRFGDRRGAIRPDPEMEVLLHGMSAAEWAAFFAEAGRLARKLQRHAEQRAGK